MRTLSFLVLLVTFSSVPARPAGFPLKGDAAKLYQQARDTGRFFTDAAKLQPEIRPTSDGRSYLLVWKGSPAPKRWIVSLHGAGRPAKGFATDDLAVWHPHLKDRDVGLVCLQWWLGTGDGPRDFLMPEQIYREIDHVLASLGVAPGAAMLHGFSRGSANSYAVVALDAGRGRRYFSLAIASSGGVALDYPPTRALLAGIFGEHPLKGTRWITVAGGRDPNPDRDGIAGMKRTAAWLQEQGASVVESIEDPTSGHGALHLNPKNTRRVLDMFLKLDAKPRGKNAPLAGNQAMGRGLQAAEAFLCNEERPELGWDGTHISVTARLPSEQGQSGESSTLLRRERRAPTGSLPLRAWRQRGRRP